MPAPQSVPPSDFDRRVVLKSRVSTKDATGQASLAWTTVATVWARRRPLRSREAVSAGQMQTDGALEYRIRHSAAVAAVADTWRLEDGGVYCDVVGVLPIGRNKYIDLMCAPGIKDGR